MNPLRILRPFVIAALIFSPIPAVAQQVPQHAYGQFTVASSATKLPTQLVGLCAISVYNGDTVAIFVGFDSSVTTSTGTPIAAGATWNATISYQSAGVGTVVYLISAAGTASNVVKYLEAC